MNQIQESLNESMSQLMNQGVTKSPESKVRITDDPRSHDQVVHNRYIGTVENQGEVNHVRDSQQLNHTPTSTISSIQSANSGIEHGEGNNVKEDEERDHSKETTNGHDRVPTSITVSKVRNSTRHTGDT